MNTMDSPAVSVTLYQSSSVPLVGGIAARYLPCSRTRSRRGHRRSARPRCGCPRPDAGEVVEPVRALGPRDGCGRRARHAAVVRGERRELDAHRAVEARRAGAEVRVERQHRRRRRERRAEGRGLREWYSSTSTSPIFVVHDVTKRAVRATRRARGPRGRARPSARLFEFTETSTGVLHAVSAPSAHWKPISLTFETKRVAQVDAPRARSTASHRLLRGNSLE